MNELERRNFNFDIRAENNERGYILTGRPVVYNQVTNLGGFDEVIEPGALNETDLRDVRFLVNHDLSKIPLARSRRNNGNSTMQLTPDAQGLSLDWVQLDVDNNADAKALYSAVQRRDISGMSFMFRVDGEEWENLESEHPTRHITKVGTIIEISAVSFPAYEGTEIYARSNEALESARHVLDSARQQRAASVDTLALEKAKFDFLMRR